MTEDMRGHLDDTTLDRWRTGELAEGERTRVAEHLERCEECARALAELEAFAGTVGRAYAADRAAADAQAPDMARLRERIEAATRAREFVARRRAWTRWMPHAAAAVVALLVVGVLWREGFRAPEDAGRLARPESAAVERALEGAAEPAAPPAGRDEAATSIAAERGEAAAPVRERDAAVPAPRPEAPPPPAEYRQRQEELAKAREAEEAAPEAQAADALADAPAAGLAVDPHDRFAARAREALAARDTAAARRTLALWRDTLSPRAELAPALRRQAESLADSLAAFLAE